MNDNVLRWHNETLIGRSSSNINYWGQYDKLIDFVLEEFPKTKTRVEVIAAPLLHLISHSLELAYKSNIRYFQAYTKIPKPQKFKDWNGLYKSHIIKKLHEEFDLQMKCLFSKYNVQDDLVEQFNRYYKQAEKLILLLNANTEKFRYAEKLDYLGNVTGRVIDSTETINILDVKELYKPTMKLLLTACDEFGIYTDYVDFQKEFPGFNNGKGYLFMNKFSNSGDSDFYISQLDLQFKKITANLWYYERDNEYFTYFKSAKFLYIVTINDVSKFYADN